MVIIQSFGAVWKVEGGVVMQTTDTEASDIYTRFAEQNVGVIGGDTPDADIELARMFIKHLGGKILLEAPDNGQDGDIN